MVSNSGMMLTSRRAFTRQQQAGFLEQQASSSRSETPSVFEMMQLGSAAAP
jgi:hypothetical protein